MEKISVIVPVYNVEKLLKKCLDSIICQTYTNLEIIVVDDGSTDSSSLICDEYANRDPRISVIHKINGGLSDARNVGIDASNGKYLLFVDSDDYIERNMIEKLYYSINTNNADLAICNFRYVSDDDYNSVDNSDLPIKDEVISGKDVLTCKLFKEKPWYWVVAVCKLYRVALFNNLRFKKGKLHEDEFILHEILLNCNRIACMSDMLYNYYQRAGSIMDTKMDIRRLDSAEALFYRADNLLSYDEYKNAAFKYMLFGASNFHSYYVRIGYKADLAHKKRNITLQKNYRLLFKNCIRKRAKCSIKEMIKSVLNYISLFGIGKIVWKMRMIKLTLTRL